LPASALASPPEATADAELASIVFVDADLGWAVGDRGAIWHTPDGGRNWQQQQSPVTCRLASVSFVDHERGWIVGGSHRGYTHESEGVVLRTVDGGRTWENVPGLQLPALKHVRFFDARRGMAVGDSSPLFPSGIYTTADGGQTWTSHPATQQTDWHAADFFDLRTGLVAAASGQFAFTGGQELKPSGLPNLAGRRVEAVKLDARGTAWLCGEGGLLLTSADRGANWSPPETLLPDVARSFDFNAVATLGAHVWVTGNPGTLVFHSPDGGRSWRAYPTDQTLPLRSLFFLDEHRGWAVGSLGTILATRDGGQSWRVQRQGGTRAALLAIVGDAGRIPHEMIVQQAGNEGFLTAIEVVTRPAGPFQDASHKERLREAGSVLLASHASSAWQFPLHEIDRAATLEQLLARWNARHEGQVLARLEEHLVRRIRTWRPEVIVTDDAHPLGDDPLAHLTNQLVLAAVQKAADPQQHRHLAAAGLPEWKVKKVFAAASGEKQGDVKIVTSQLAPRLGGSLADFADDARSRLDRHYRLAPASAGFVLLVDHLPQGQGRRDFFSGIALQPASESRRSLSHPPNPDLAGLSKQIHKRQLLQGLLERSNRDAVRGTAWLAQATEMTRGLPPASSARVLDHLAQRYEASGDLELAAEVRSTLAEKFPDQPLSDAALVWLIRHYTSGEAEFRLGRRTQYSEHTLGAGRTPRTPEAAAADREVQPVGAVEDAEKFRQGLAVVRSVGERPTVPATRAEQALRWGQVLEKRRPALHADPGVRFALATAARRQRNSAQADRILSSLALTGGEGWSQCAKAELWLANQGEGHCPKKTLACLAAKSKPKLDGHLDDEVWQAAKAVSLRDVSDGNAEPLDSFVAMAYDDEFLYVAISCARTEGRDYTTDNAVRSRDADLSRRDRVELSLDTDRDYASAFRLAVDHRGWTNERLSSDAAWDPTWYVAAAGDESVWTVEAAIPLVELTAIAPQKQTHWAIGLTRIVPGQQSQSWTLPEGAEGFGLLRFE
jgi:photosystem II stability/assembly factor-like uncharacterized protein